MKYKFGVSVCVSSQVGCRMGCRFCASTLDGVVRNLEPSEMLDQIYRISRITGEKVRRVVVMGSGEPMDNYDNVLKFIRLLSDEKGMNMSQRNLTVSTCGIVPAMFRLAEENLPVTLCVSLHAPTDEIRRKTMPVAERWSIQEILEACRNYIQKTGRRVIFEYALVDGINAGEAEARKLAERLRGMQCHVNLIPLNEVRERKLKGVREDTVTRFMKILEDEHISVTRRREMGDDIEGACGQLRRSVVAGDQTRGAEEDHAKV
jgi:23S rRNA (adenine2503-C2)-methyltransferase